MQRGGVLTLDIVCFIKTTRAIIVTTNHSKIFTRVRDMTLKEVLEEAGITLKDHPELYKASIENATYADKLSMGFKELKEVGATPQDHPALYETTFLKLGDKDS